MKKLALLLITPFITWGCANTHMAHQEPPEFKSILVAPIVNESVDVSVGEILYYQMPRWLAERGYYVFPMRTVTAVLEQEGLYEPEKVRALGPEKLTALFDADAVIYTKITYWDTKYGVLLSAEEAHIEVEIYSKDGRKLLEKKLVETFSPNSAGISVVGNVALSTLQRATQNHQLVASMLAMRLFNEVAPGPYKNSGTN